MLIHGIATIIKGGFSLLVIIAFVLGMVAGLLSKGIHIYHHKEAKITVPKEFNPSSADKLPSEMKEYAQKNQGYINF